MKKKSFSCYKEVVGSLFELVFMGDYAFMQSAIHKLNKVSLFDSQGGRGRQAKKKTHSGGKRKEKKTNNSDKLRLCEKKRIYFVYFFHQLGSGVLLNLSFCLGKNITKNERKQDDFVKRIFFWTRTREKLTTL